MKSFFLLVSAAVALSASPLPARAQEPVSTGFVQEVIPKTGVLTIVSDQLRRPVTFYAADKTTISRADGQAAQLSDIQVGMPVTVRYAEQGGQWYIEKIMFDEPKAAAVAPAAPVVSQGRVEALRRTGP